jgi:O-acetylhomoserine (thiol)-lyase
MNTDSSVTDNDFKIADILAQTKIIAMVGASSNWKRPSYFVMRYLQKHGYRVIPVNPGSAGQEILGELCYATLTDIPGSIDLVDIFQQSARCEPIVTEAIAIGAKNVWMQIGVENKNAAAAAEAAGMTVIMNRCTKIEHSRLSGLLGLGGFYSGFISSHRAPISPPPVPARDGGLFKTDNLDTLAVHAGTRPDPASGSRIQPVHQTTAFVFDDTDHATGLYNLQEPGNIYARLSNPTTAALEQRIAALDNAVGACCVASGHAAQMVALFPLMAPGRKIIASNRLYGGSITQFGTTFKNFGWDAAFVDVRDMDAVRTAVADEKVAALFAESLANPDGNISDIERLSDIAHEVGIPLIIDNTMATPILCQPGAYGADLVIYSTTKFLSGHGNAMGGAIVDTGNFDWLGGRGYPALAKPDSAYHGITFAETFGNLGFITYCHANALRDLGPTMSPHNAYLTLMGMETLPLRMQKHMDNAAAVASFLSDHKKVESVSWAGLPTSPYNALAKKYFTFGFGSVFTASIKGDYEAAQNVVHRCNMISHLANVGDTRTLIVHPASTTHRQLSEEQRQAAGVGDNLLRLSIGIENAEDIIADLDAALAGF